jgi:hypothetical protein
MREGVIPNLVTLFNHAPDQIGICLAILADYKECRRHMFLLQNLEDLGSPSGIRSVIESERYPTRMIAGTLDHVP